MTKSFTDFFYADFGKEFPSRTFWRDPETGPLQALCSALRSTEQSTSRGGEKGEKVPREGEEEGWPAKGTQRKKGHAKTGQFTKILCLKGRGFLNDFWYQ